MEVVQGQGGGGHYADPTEVNAVGLNVVGGSEGERDVTPLCPSHVEDRTRTRSPGCVRMMQALSPQRSVSVRRKEGEEVGGRSKGGGDPLLIQFSRLSGPPRVTSPVLTSSWMTQRAFPRYLANDIASCH